MGRSRLFRLFAFVRSAHMRSAVVLTLDAIATAAGLQAALLLRFGGELPEDVRRMVWVLAPALVLVRLLSIFVARLHRWSFRMSGLSEAVRLVVAHAAATCFFVVLIQLGWGWQVPRTIVALEFFATLTLMAGFRFTPRIYTGWYSEQLRNRRGAQHTIIVGAGSAGDLLMRDLNRCPAHDYSVVGFLDDDPNKIGTWLGGRPVLGSIDQLPLVIEKLHVEMVLLAIPRLPAERVRDILNLCGSQKARFKIIPASYAYLDDHITSAMLHDLSPEDLLARDQVSFDHTEIRRLVADKRVLITGGAGSIGGEIATQVTENGARTVVLVDLNENELYLLARRLRERFPGSDVRTEVADIRDAARLRRLGDGYRPHLVFHAAAHKHVPLMEEAPEEAVKNNVVGTLNVARMATHCAAERLVFISTDKAVKPSSVMGVSKRVGELVVRDVCRGTRTQATAIRFGNVLGSAGSVVPIFKEQIERGGPVTVTHPECTRYFMTIPEAVGLVLIAGLGGHGELCILDMGEPIRIADLAANLITMAGYVPGTEIPIAFTGLRPGEKLHEELLTEEEEETHTVRNRIHAARSPAPPSNLLALIEELRARAEVGDREAILDLFQELVPTFSVTPNGHVAPDPLPEREPVDQGSVKAAADVVPLRAASVRRNERLA